MLKSILLRKQYPRDVIDRTIGCFNSERLVPKAQKEEKLGKRFLKLPYVNNKCEDYALRLKNLVESDFPQVEFKMVPTPSYLGKLKNRMQRNLHRQNKENSRTRINEHMAKPSSETGKKDPSSACAEHKIK